jgi:hypothetical protein
MFDAIFKTTPLDIWDVNVLHGHNIIFDQNEHRFRFFDYDMIFETDKPHLSKMLSLFERVVTPKHGTTPELNQVELLIHYLTLFSDEHSEQHFEILNNNKTTTVKIDPVVTELSKNNQPDQLKEYIGRARIKEEFIHRGRMINAPPARRYIILVEVK